MGELTHRSGNIIQMIQNNPKIVPLNSYSGIIYVSVMGEWGWPFNLSELGRLLLGYTAVSPPMALLKHKLDLLGEGEEG